MMFNSLNQFAFLESDGGLSTGAVVAILITIVLLTLVGICIAYFLVRRRKVSFGVAKQPRV